jgi:hypothetical protein
MKRQISRHPILSLEVPTRWMCLLSSGSPLELDFRASVKPLENLFDVIVVTLRKVIPVGIHFCILFFQFVCWRGC